MDMEQVCYFLSRHMIQSSMPETVYRYCVLLYYSYRVEGLKEAQKMEDGEVFDEFRMIALIHEVKDAQDNVQIMKKMLGHKTDLYDISEQITFPGGRLRAGIYTGDPSAAISAAKSWVATYQIKMESPFLFETGVYILTLLGEEIVIR